MDLGDEYQVSGLVELCVAALEESLSPDTVGAVLGALRRHSHIESVAEAHATVLRRVQGDFALIEKLAAMAR